MSYTVWRSRILKYEFSKVNFEMRIASTEPKHNEQVKLSAFISLLKVWISDLRTNIPFTVKVWSANRNSVSVSESFH